ncbi:hypothetical protein [Nitrosomonas sp.]|uniref:hypothetical protein n=1 Tax=Nitrosomonas sp. TaxID=42353 RepID=UPI0025E0D746|nr:hypothetical protein [Nitrosomonas sp.]
MTIGCVWRDAMQGERMSHSTSYGDDEQRRSVPARCDPGVTVIYERLLNQLQQCLTGRLLMLQFSIRQVRFQLPLTPKFNHGNTNKNPKRFLLMEPEKQCRNINNLGDFF